MAVTLLLVFYLVVTFQRSALLLMVTTPLANALGAGYLALPALGAWTLFRELRFSAHTEQMARALEAEGSAHRQSAARPQDASSAPRQTRNSKSIGPKQKMLRGTGIPGSGSAVRMTPPVTASVNALQCGMQSGCTVWTTPERRYRNETRRFRGASSPASAVRRWPRITRHARAAGRSIPARASH